MLKQPPEVVTASYTYLEKAGAELFSAPASTGVLLQFLLQAAVPAQGSVTVIPSTLSWANLRCDPYTHLHSLHSWYQQ